MGQAVLSGCVFASRLRLPLGLVAEFGGRCAAVAYGLFPGHDLWQLAADLLGSVCEPLRLARCGGGGRTDGNLPRPVPRGSPPVLFSHRDDVALYAAGAGFVGCAAGLCAAYPVLCHSAYQRGEGAARATGGLPGVLPSDTFPADSAGVVSAFLRG